MLSIVLMLGTGVSAFVLTARANDKSEALHRQDRLTLQTTLGGLSNQYLLFAFKDELDFASTGPWSLAPGNKADEARLQAFVSRSAITNYGAALVSLTRQPLSTYAADPAGLPAPNDGGFAPLVTGLLQNQPGLSSVMH
ncbi:MAG: hypothetical protein JO176_08335, partial [Acidimicrobiia bacterium]|nr:hypothetical protein [Acidimicrobiia bacterium]